MNFLETIEASLESLSEARLIGFDLKSIKGAYSEVLYCYLSGDIGGLEKVVNSLCEQGKSNNEWEIVAELSILRLKVRKRLVSLNDCECLLRLAEANPLWSGEIYFVIGLACDVADLQTEAQKYFAIAARDLEKFGANRKALLARYNSLVSITHLEPERKMIVDYQRLYRRARSLRDDYLAALMLINISREFQKIDAIRSALRFVNRALAHLRRGQMGTVTHYLALVHRADLLMSMDRQIDAILDIETASMSEFPEVRAAIKVLSNKKLESSKEELDKNLIPNWKERLDLRTGKLVRKPILGEMEDKLLQMIGIRPRTKFELIDELYGDSVDLQFLEARLKSMIYRIRQKIPNAIVFNQNRYQLADESVIDRQNEGKWA
jgi:hypothetical protein